VAQSGVVFPCLGRRPCRLWRTLGLGKLRRAVTAIRENSSPCTLVGAPSCWGSGLILDGLISWFRTSWFLFGGSSSSRVCSRFGRQACTTRPVDDGNRDVMAVMMMQHVCLVSIVKGVQPLI